MKKRLIFALESNTLLDTRKIAEKISQQIRFPACVYLDAPMGAGKTTLVQSMVRYFDANAVVTSPTYSLVQEYPLAQAMIFHLDLYRLDDAEEYWYLGLEDRLAENTLCLIEWPTKAAQFVPPATHIIEIALTQNQRRFCFYQIEP